MSDISHLVKAAITSVLALATVTTVHAAQTTAIQQQKCYGIVKAGMNDCETTNTSCAGSSVVDKQSDAYIFLPQGTCDKIVGSTLKPIKPKHLK